MTMLNPYEALANGIITQAANDYRKAKKYLAKHPLTEALKRVVAAQREERKKRREELKALGLPKEREKKSKEERLYESIISNKSMVYDTEKFFRSEWFSQLTSIDGEMLLRRLENEVEADGL